MSRPNSRPVDIYLVAAKRPGLTSRGSTEMSTITRESTQAPVALPQAGRGDALFGATAVLVGLCALVVKFSGLFG
jgi:hypothetical protein